MEYYTAYEAAAEYYRAYTAYELERLWAIELRGGDFRPRERFPLTSVPKRGILENRKPPHPQEPS